MALIAKTKACEKNNIRNVSVQVMPDRPSEAGQSAAQVKNAITEPVFGNDHSILKELDRVVDALNTLLSGSTTEGSSLSTTATNLIGAINELRGKITNGSSYPTLGTTATTIMEAINEIRSKIAGSEYPGLSFSADLGVTTIMEALNSFYALIQSNGSNISSLGNKIPWSSLDNGKVPAAYLPSYVDDVLVFDTLNKFPGRPDGNFSESEYLDGLSYNGIPEAGKIYIAADTNKTYRYAGTTETIDGSVCAKYVEISESLSLGETSSTAFPGDRGVALENGKVDKITTGTGIRIPVTDASGNQAVLQASASADAGTVAVRGTGGVVKVGTPSDNGDATTKGYVDSVLSNKQNTTDNSLETTAKTIVGAINETNSIAKGATTGIVFDSYEDMVEALLALDDSDELENPTYKIGTSVYIKTLNVPDLWIWKIGDSDPDYAYYDYEYVSDAALINDFYEHGHRQLSLHIGYYWLAPLETEKVDLSSYYNKTQTDNLLAPKLTEPAIGLAKGKYFRVASIDANGHAVLEFVDAPTAPIQGVSAAGTALTPDANGAVDIPSLGNNRYGLIRISGFQTGLMLFEGELYLSTAGSDILSSRGTQYSANYGGVTSANYDLAVKLAMTDGIGAAWTDAERLAALLRMGCTVENGIVKSGTELTFSVSNSNATVTGGGSKSNVIVIPSTYNGYPVTSIGNNAFKNNTNLTSVIIPDSVTSIGNNAFHGCTGLTDVTMGTGVTTIGQYAFNQTKISSITIPNGCETIGASAFTGCNYLTAVTIPNSVTTIGEKAFYGCGSLETVTIGDSVSQIGELVFCYCTGITSMTINASTPPTLASANAFYRRLDTNATYKLSVPSPSLSLYQNATNWSSLSSRLQAIPS